MPTTLQQRDWRAFDLEAEDGLRLVGDLWSFEGEARPAVLLVHDLGADRGVWRQLGARLADEGFLVLSTDLRGHGETGGATNWTNALLDGEDLVRWLTRRDEVDRDRIAIVGAGVGGEIALAVGAFEPVSAVVAVSPGVTYGGIDLLPATLELEPRPVLFVVGADDRDGVEAAHQFVGSSLEVVEVPGDVRSHAALDRSTDLVVAWLVEQLGP